MNAELVMAQLVANCVLLKMTETEDIKSETRKMYENYCAFMGGRGMDTPLFEDFVFQKAKVPDLRFIYRMRDTVEYTPRNAEDTDDWKLGYIIGYGDSADSETVCVMTDSGARVVNVLNIRRAKLPKELLNLAVSLARTA